MSEEVLFDIRTLQGSVIKSLFDTLKVSNTSYHFGYHD